MAWLSANWGLVASLLLGVSEALSLIPGLKANGILDMLIKGLKALGAQQPPAA